MLPRHRLYASALALPLLLGIAVTAACGGSDDADSGPSRPTLPAAVTTAGAGEIVTLGETPLVAVRTLPAPALSADALSPEGAAIIGGGGSLEMARTTDGGVRAWEYVSAAADGWRIWEPAILGDVLADAGAGAAIVNVEPVDWPDACLGVPVADEVCAQVVTPGFRVIVEQGGRPIEYHAARVAGFRIAA